MGVNGGPWGGELVGVNRGPWGGELLVGEWWPCGEANGSE